MVRFAAAVPEELENVSRRLHVWHNSGEDAVYVSPTAVSHAFENVTDAFGRHALRGYGSARATRHRDGDSVAMK